MWGLYICSSFQQWFDQEETQWKDRAGPCMLVYCLCLLATHSKSKTAFESFSWWSTVTSGFFFSSLLAPNCFPASIWCTWSPITGFYSFFFLFWSSTHAVLVPAVPPPQCDFHWESKPFSSDGPGLQAACVSLLQAWRKAKMKRAEFWISCPVGTE